MFWRRDFYSWRMDFYFLTFLKDFFSKRLFSIFSEGMRVVQRAVAVGCAGARRIHQAHHSSGGKRGQIRRVVSVENASAQKETHPDMDGGRCGGGPQRSRPRLPRFMDKVILLPHIFAFIPIHSLLKKFSSFFFRFDSDMTLIRTVAFEQPDYQLLFLARHERDVVAQLAAMEALEAFKTVETKAAFTTIVENEKSVFNGLILPSHTQRHSIDWLIDLSVDRSIDWLISSSIDWLICVLIDRLIDWLAYDLCIEWLIDWLIDWFVCWSIDWLID